MRSDCDEAACAVANHGCLAMNQVNNSSKMMDGCMQLLEDLELKVPSEKLADIELQATIDGYSAIGKVLLHTQQPVSVSFELFSSYGCFHMFDLIVSCCDRAVGRRNCHHQCHL